MKNKHNKQKEQDEQEPTEGIPSSEPSVFETALLECEDKYIRVLAEYDNFRKRSKKEQESSYSFGFSQGIAAFLPVVDNISRAVAGECLDEEYKKGICLIEKQLLEQLGKLNIEAIGTVGDTFDPELHNAVMHIDDDAFGENQVCEVFQNGYKIGERVIRFATVKVAN